jgi:hypothetical protein
MLAVMSKVRLVLMVEEETREALRLESALSSQDMSLIVEELIRTHLSEALEQIRERRTAKPKRNEKKS